LLLAACGTEPADNAAQSSAPTPARATPQPETPRIDCAPPGAADLTPVCTLDRTETESGVILTLRHPDGAFHRLQITRDGRGVIAADGAEPAKVTPLGPDRIEIELGGARYRLPATVRGQPQ
jgi:hemin uptake protein HemP